MLFSGSFTGSISEVVNAFIQANPGVIVAHVLSSISAVIFIVYFFWKPTNKFILKQREKLDKVHNSLAKATKETKLALNNLQAEQEKFIEEREQFLVERKKKEEEILAKRIEEAEKIKADMIEESTRRVKLMEEELKKTVNQKIITLSVELAEKLIQQSITKRTQSKIIDGYLSEIDTVFKNQEKNSLKEIGKS